MLPGSLQPGRISLNRWQCRLGAVLFLSVGVAFFPDTYRAAAADADPAHAGDQERIAAALKRGLPLVQTAAAHYPEHRKCFSCHHQTLPLLAITKAASADKPAEADILKSQGEFTHAAFQKQIDDLRDGKNIGGRALTVGYGLWALSLSNWPANETTEAMVDYLLITQQDDGHWELHANRPPMEQSAATCIALAIEGMRKYGPPSREGVIRPAIEKATAWLVDMQPSTGEDVAARLWGMQLGAKCVAAVPAEQIDKARAAILAAQRDDGGWAQLSDMASDAYATGQTLFVLQATGLPVTAPAYARGVRFLLDAQREDGSWLVESRSKPIQVYFDNGDPHGKHQFISTPSSCWALAALAAAR